MQPTVADIMGEVVSVSVSAPVLGRNEAFL